MGKKNVFWSNIWGAVLCFVLFVPISFASDTANAAVQEKMNFSSQSLSISDSITWADNVTIDTEKGNVTGNLLAYKALNFNGKEINISGTCKSMKINESAGTKVSSKEKSLCSEKELEAIEPLPYEWAYIEDDFRIKNWNKSLIEGDKVCINDFVCSGEMTYNVNELQLNNNTDVYSDVVIHAKKVNCLKDVLIKGKNIYISADEVTFNGTLTADQKLVIEADKINITGKLCANKILIKGKTVKLTNKIIPESMYELTMTAKETQIIFSNGDSCYHVTKNIILPNDSDDYLKVSWKSSSPKYIDDNGKVVRPNDGKSREVILTATFSKDGFSNTKRYKVLVVRQKTPTVFKQKSIEELKVMNLENKEALEDLECLANGRGNFLDSIHLKYTGETIDSPEEALASLKCIQSYLGIENNKAEFEWVDTEKFMNDITYKFRQVYKGIPVENRGFDFKINEDRTLLYVINSYNADVNKAHINVKPAFSIAKVKNQLMQQYGKNITFDNFNLIIYIHNTSPKLVWRISVRNIDKKSKDSLYEFYIDAHTGSTIGKKCNGSFIR